ncbi:helix-turn-helix transcriptional regulator [Lachnospiraceae bacterium 46-61]
MVRFSYKNLWELLIDRDIKHKNLINKTGMSRNTFYKLKNDENVPTDILLKICEFLQYDILEIMTHINETDKKKG